MTTVSIAPITSPTLSGLNAYPTIGGIGLEWNSTTESTYFSTEVWRATSNNRASASLWATVFNNAYIDTDVTTNTTYYYWIRSVDIFGRTTGAWYPVSSTGGVSSASTYVDTPDIQLQAVSVDNLNPDNKSNVFNAGAYGQYKTTRDTTSTGFSDAGGSSTAAYIGTGTIGGGSGISKAAAEPGSSFATWYDVMGSGYVSVSANIKKVNVLGAWLEIDWDTVSVASGSVSIWVELVLRNRTDSTDIETIDLEVVKIGTGGVLKCTPLINLSGHFFSNGISTLVAANKDFDIRWRMKKTRTDAASTLTMYWVKGALEFDVEE